MSWSEILNIVLGILGIFIALVGYYFKVKQTIVDKTNGLIADAEDLTHDGSTKMAYVVDELYHLVPIALRAIFTKNLLEKIVQEAFDKIESYATKQVEKHKIK